MKIFNAAIFILVLFYPNLSTEWPTHTVCKENNLEIYYKSCVKGFGFSATYYSSDILLATQDTTSLFYMQPCHRVGSDTLDFLFASSPHVLLYPVQDFAFSIDRCSEILTNTFNIRAAMVLRQSIKELFLSLNLIINGKSLLGYSQTLCEPKNPRFIFCGVKKGEHIYYEGPIKLGIHEIPQGEYKVSVRLHNEDRLTVACADFTIKNTAKK